MLIENHERKIFSKDIIESNIIIIFGELLRTYQDNNSQEYIGSSKTYLGDILHSKDLIRIQRVTRLCIFLTNSRMNIDDITNEVGYKEFRIFL